MSTLESLHLKEVGFRILRKGEKGQSEIVVREGIVRTDGGFLVHRTKKGPEPVQVYYLDPEVPLIPLTIKSGMRKKTIRAFRFLEGTCDPLEPGGYQVHWSRRVEDMLMAGFLKDEVDVATSVPAFKISRDLAIAMILGGVMASFFGLSLNDLLHIVPPTVTHWLGSAPA